ncbi:unnamed protein product, partial [Phaeothamnion confervicola]
VGWYLGLDVQLFLLSPPLLFLYVRRPAAGAAAVLALTIASIAFSAWFSAEYHLSPSIFDPHFGGDSGGGTAYLPDYYFRPWCRAPAYLIGLLAAFCWDSAGMQDEAAASIRLPEAGALGLAAAWLLLLGSTCYGGYWMYQDIPSGLPQWVLTLYLSLSKPAWAAGLAALSLLCAAGRGGFAGWLLSRPFWAPLSRLNYSMYLAHPVAIYWLY